MATDIRQLTADGRKAYLYWHLMLLLKKRKLEKKLITAGYLTASTEVSDDETPLIAPELHALRDLGFPLPEQLPASLIKTDALRAVRIFFKVNTAFDDATILTLDVVKQLANSKYERRSLLRADRKRQPYLQNATDRFNTALERFAMDKVYRMALFWTACHQVSASDWQAIAATFVEDPAPLPQSAIVVTDADHSDNPLALLGIEPETVSDTELSETENPTPVTTSFNFTDNLFD